MALLQYKNYDVSAAKQRADRPVTTPVVCPLKNRHKVICHNYITIYTVYIYYTGNFVIIEALLQYICIQSTRAYICLDLWSLYYYSWRSFMSFDNSLNF